MAVRTLRECDRRHEEIDATKPFYKVKLTVVQMVPDPEDPRKAVEAENPVMAREMEVCEACKDAVIANLGRYVTLQDEKPKAKKGGSKAAPKDKAAPAAKPKEKPAPKAKAEPKEEPPAQEPPAPQQPTEEPPAPETPTQPPAEGEDFDKAPQPASQDEF